MYIALMKKILPLLFFFFHELCGTITIPFTMDVGGGFRQDHLKIGIFDPGDSGALTYREDYQHISFAQTELTLRTVRRDIFLLANIGYGAIGSGKLTQGPIFLDFSPETPTFYFTTSAQAYHALGIFGYQVNLTPDRYYTVAFTPLLGYSWYYEQINRKSPHPNPYSSPVFPGEPDVFQMTSGLHKDLTAEWNGFFIGADVQIYPGGRVTLNATYAYHFMALRQHLYGESNVRTFSGSGALLLDETTQFSTKVNTGGNHGHLGILKAACAFTQKWSGILYGKILYLTSHIRTIKVKEQTITNFPSHAETTEIIPRKYEFRQTTLEVLLELSYGF